MLFSDGLCVVHRNNLVHSNAENKLQVLTTVELVLSVRERRRQIEESCTINRK